MPADTPDSLAEAEEDAAETEEATELSSEDASEFATDAAEEMEGATGAAVVPVCARTDVIEDVVRKVDVYVDSPLMISVVAGQIVV